MMGDHGGIVGGGSPGGHVADDGDDVAAGPDGGALLIERGAQARARGAYVEAALDFEAAAALATASKERLYLLMRSAYCHWAADDFDRAFQVAEQVAERARAEGHDGELVDALSLLVDRAMTTGQYAKASEWLGEAAYVMERLPNEPEHYQVVHNIAVTYHRCEFAQPALELFDRALRLATNEADRCFAYASMCATYHSAYLQERDPVLARQHLEHGVIAANAALDPEAPYDLLTTVTARAHRAMLLNHLGRHAEALPDARFVCDLANAHQSMTEEYSVGLIGLAVARWALDRDEQVLELIETATALASRFGSQAYVAPARRVQVEILWGQGRFDDARAVLEEQVRALDDALAGSRAARWEHVRLGISHRTTEAISEADPLTGLPNRRYLGNWLPAVLREQVPVCVAMLDLDGFKRINDEWSYTHGDRVLQELAGILQRVCRRGDAVVRLGGDEFVIVLRDTSPNDARNVLERVRQMIAARTWEGLPSSVRLSASVGVTVGNGSSDAAALLVTATEALQSAKREGRDRIVFR